jgi:hypothetical protein
MKTTEKMENNVFIKVESFYNINNKIVEQIWILNFWQKLRT